MTMANLCCDLAESAVGASLRRVQTPRLRDQGVGCPRHKEIYVALPRGPFAP